MAAILPFLWSCRVLVAVPLVVACSACQFFGGLLFMLLFRSFVWDCHHAVGLVCPDVVFRCRVRISLLKRLLEVVPARRLMTPSCTSSSALFISSPFCWLVKHLLPSCFPCLSKKAKTPKIRACPTKSKDILAHLKNCASYISHCCLCMSINCNSLAYGPFL